MRDLKKAIGSAKKKLRLFGFSKFILKSIEVIISTFFSFFNFKMKFSKSCLINEFSFVNSKMFSSENDIILSQKLLEELIDYQYTVFNKKLNFSSNENISTRLWCVKRLLRPSEYEEIFKTFSNYKLHRWHYDPLNNYEFKSLLIPYNEAEIKIPWEFGRFNLYPQLAIHSDDKDKVAHLFSRDIISFYCVNSATKNNVQWANAMEAGIRIFNILLTLSILKKKKAHIPLGIERIIKSGVNLHLKYIAFNNEFSFLQTSNHYAANLLGLAAINSQYKSKFINYIINYSFKSEVYRNTNHGLLNEGSTAYHRFTSEIYFSIYLLLIDYGNDKSPELERVFRQMANIVFNLESPLGVHTQFGDSDGGFLNWIAIPYSKSFNLFTPYVVENYRKYVDFIFEKLDIPLISDIPDRVAKLGGGALIVIRIKSLFLVINNILPEKNVYNKTHFHDDHGYIELFHKNTALSIDPGTYCYTSDLEARSKYQSSDAHYKTRKFIPLDNPFSDFVRSINHLNIEETDELVAVTITDKAKNISLFHIEIRDDSFNYKMYRENNNEQFLLFLNYLSEPTCLEK